MYAIFTTLEYDKEFNKLDNQLQKQIDKEILLLKDAPFSGKSINYKFFREKKIKNYRIYYLVYSDYLVVFLISLSTKKDQQKTINKIKKLIPFYYQELKQKFNP